MKGYEDPWRKHHQSSITRDIWLCDLSAADRTYQKLTTFKGEDRNPVWTPDGSGFYYLSEEDGSFNVYRRSLDGSAKQQLTHHKEHPVRFLSAATDGTPLLRLQRRAIPHERGSEGTEARCPDCQRQGRERLDPTDTQLRATDIAVSPNDGKEVAFIVRGDVYVASVEYETTKQITSTPQQERNIDFSPDGRTLVYSAERGETWGIYQTRLVREEDKYFTYAQELKEEPLVVGNVTSFQPKFSPDGKELAFLLRTAPRCAS